MSEPKAKASVLRARKVVSVPFLCEAASGESVTIAPVPPELRLLHLLTLNAAVAAAACRFATKKTGPTRLAIAVDAFLLWYLLQYLAVALPGFLGLLGPWSMTLTAAALSAALWWAAGRGDPLPRRDPIDPAERRAWAVCGAFLIGMLAVVIHGQWLLPPMANDPLTYHLPAAVRWLQTGYLDVYPTWFFNPANAYSPLAGSTFLAWLLAPMGNDLAARFGQAPAALMLFLAVGQVAKNLGAGPAAAVVALAAALCRPVMGEATLAKDDLFLAAFFAAAAAGLSRERLRDPAAPWRIGVAVGLMLAVKFTALLALPVLLLALDAPWRAGWRLKKWAVALGVAGLLAVPWYLRNLLAHGNPVFPVSTLGLPGLFTTARAAALSTVGGAWGAVVTSYVGTTAPLAVALLIVWMLAAVAARRDAWRDPLKRLCVAGPPLGVALFFVLSPYAEVRFLLPSLLLLTAGAAAAFRWGKTVGWIVAVTLATVAAGTSFIPVLLAQFLPAAAAVAAVLVGVGLLWINVRDARLRGGAALLVGLLAAGAVYVYWPAAVENYRLNAAAAWPVQYGGLAEAWNFVRDHAPPGGTVAYAQTHFPYPLAGFDLDRHVVYAPVRPGVRTVADLGWLGDGLSGQKIDAAASRAANAGADRAVWLQNLRATGAAALFVAKPASGESPPELAWAEADSAYFRKVFENADAAVFEVR